MAFADDWPIMASGQITVTGVTDNCGNTAVCSKLMTSKFPSVVVLAELAAQLRTRKIDLQLEWAPREQNEHADALTNDHFGEFDPTRRVNLDINNMQFEVLRNYMDVAEALFKETVAAKGGPRPAKAPRRGLNQKLRTTHPW